MKVVLNHFSFRTCLDIKDLFQFLDIEIAGKVKTKFGHYVNFGLEPYFKEELVCNIKKITL